MFTPQPFARRYLLLDRIATGGMAEVFKAKSYGVEGFEKLVVIKRILPHLSRNARFVSMFINEAKIAVSLNHGNIVQVFHLGKHVEDYFIAMEYVHGRDLMQVVKACRLRNETIPIPLLMYIVAETARGLDYAHRKQDPAGNRLEIIHRDISPHNLVLSFEGEVKIVDFGIARIASQIMEEGQKNRLGGKFAYMSPEQAEGGAMDSRSDLFSLGLVCYELLTGHKAYQGKGVAEKLERVRKADFEAPRNLRPDLPDGLERILLKALAFKPEDRYQSASDLYEDMTELMFSSGGVVTAQELGAYMQDLFRDDILREQQASGLKAVVGSLERMDRNGLEGTEISLAMPGDDGTAPDHQTPAVEGEANHTLESADFSIVQQLGSSKRNLLVLMAEPLGLIDLSLHMPDDRYLELLSSLIRQLQQVVAAHGGVVDGFAHERLYALWGLNKAQEDDHERALTCALELRSAMAAFRHKRGVELDLAVALHQGPALVGSIGGRCRYTALGDTFKLPERLLNLCGPGEIMVSDVIRALGEAAFRFEAGDHIRTSWGRRQAATFKVLAAHTPLERTRKETGKSARRGERWYPRKDELEILRAALASVDGRRGRVLGVSGEAGIGKTRLVGEVGRLVYKKNVGWMVGQCHYRDRETPLAVFRNMVASGCRIDRGDSREQMRDKLSTLLELGLEPIDISFIKSLFFPSEEGGPPGEPGNERHDGVFRAFRQLVRGLSADRPMLFVFENLQWMDPISLWLLQDLIDQTSDQPLLLLVTYRTGFQPPFSTRPDYQEIVLERLKREEAIEMCQSLLGVDQLPDSLAEELYHRSDGNPLYLEQLLKVLIEGGHLVLEGGRVKTVSLQAAAQVPPTLQGLIESRVDSLSETGRQVLQILSVIGRQAALTVVREVTGLGMELEPVLDELCHRDLVTVQDGQISFRNHLTWEVAYHSVIHRTLKDYHRRVGEALENLYAADLARHGDELYHHFEAAGAMVKAARYASLTADRYREEDFTSKAVDFYLKAIELLRECSGEGMEEDMLLGEMAGLYLRAGHLQAVLGDRTSAEATLEHGLDLAGELEDDELEARLLLELGRLRADKGDRFLAQSYLEHALELSEALSDQELCCGVLDTLGTFYLEGGEIEAAGRSFEKGLKLANRLERSLAVAHLLRGRGTYLFHMGDFSQSLEVFNRALALAEENNDRLLYGRILTNLGNSYSYLGRFEDAMETYRRADDVLKAIGFMRGAIINRHNIGDLYFRQERLGRAYVYFLESRNMARDYRWAMGEAMNMVYMGFIEAAKGDADIGLRTLSEGIALAAKGGHPEVVATGHWLEGLYHAGRNSDAARHAFTQGLEIARTLGNRKLEADLSTLLLEHAGPSVSH